MITVAILTVSDSAAAGAREDQSGPAIQESCEELGWRVVTSAIVPDEQDRISEQLRHWADGTDVGVIFTTGGTGVAARDVTPEATRAVLDREIPGISELMRIKGMQQTPFSALSRAVAGTRNACLIVNLPGSPKGARFSLEVIRALIPHILALLQGNTEHEPAAS